ncbi:MAG: sugar kinase [Erysipelotrichaceae bacterium]|nr:sugar kinase [Erysipelotrichaceae bacterium]
MPDRQAKAIVVGDACVDVHLRLEDLLNDASGRAVPYHLSLGGTIGGTAAALAKLGVDTAFLGTIGKDYGGGYISEEMRSLGIDTSLLIVKEELNTINVFAFIDSEGERHLWGFPRNEQAYCDLDLERVDLNKIKEASWLHSSGMTLLSGGTIVDSLPVLYKLAYEAGVETSLDLNTRVSDIRQLDPKAADAIRKILPYVRYLTGSAKDEFVSLHPAEDWRESVRYFANQDRTVIARNGREGYIVIDKGQEKEFPSYEVEAVDTTGAGDSFNAGFIAARLEGKDIFEACAYANAVAGYKISGHDNLNREKIAAFMADTALRNR